MNFHEGYDIKGMKESLKSRYDLQSSPTPFDLLQPPKFHLNLGCHKLTKLSRINSGLIMVIRLKRSFGVPRFQATCAKFIVPIS